MTSGPGVPYSDSVTVTQQNSRLRRTDKRLALVDDNPFMMNGFVHYYHLDESTSIFRDILMIFFQIHFIMKFLSVNRMDPEVRLQKAILIQIHKHQFCEA